MYRCLIIADDLTGANATISLLKNLKITTLLDLNDKNLYKNYDAISCSTESRSISESDHTIRYLILLKNICMRI